MTCIWSSWCHCHPIISAFKNPDWFILLLPAYPGCPGKKAVKQVLLFFLTTSRHCLQLKRVEEEKKKLEGVVSVLEKKVKDAVKGQGSRDALIETLQGRIHELQQQADEHKVVIESVSPK